MRVTRQYDCRYITCMVASYSHSAIIHQCLILVGCTCLLAIRSVCRNEATERHLQSPKHLKNYTNRVSFLSQRDQYIWSENQVKELTNGHRKIEIVVMSCDLSCVRQLLLGVGTRAPDNFYPPHNIEQHRLEMEVAMTNHPAPRVPDGFVQMATFTCQDCTVFHSVCLDSGVCKSGVQPRNRHTVSMRILQL